MEMINQLRAPAALHRGKASRTHWMGGSVGTRDRLDAVK